MRKTIITMLLISAATITAIAGGYQVRLQGARQTGMGLIGTPLSGGGLTLQQQGR